MTGVPQSGSLWTGKISLEAVNSYINLYPDDFRITQHAPKMPDVLTPRPDAKLLLGESVRVVVEQQ